jgi:hypothetical protein
MMNVGWSGMQPLGICAVLSPEIQVSHWMKSPDNYNQCLEVVENHFHSFLIVAQFVTYVYMVLMMLRLFGGCIVGWWTRLKNKNV